MKKQLLFLLLVSLGWRVQAQPIPKKVDGLLQQYACKGCHMLEGKLLAPSLLEIAEKKHYTSAQIVDLIYKPVPAHWPDYPPMAPVTWMPKKAARQVAEWMAGLAPQHKEPSSAVAKAHHKK